MALNTILDPSMSMPMIIASPNQLEASSTPLLDVLKKDLDGIIQQLNEYGAVLFRGFACVDAEYFSNVIELCGLGSRCSTKDYDIPRTLLPNEIYTSSDLPAAIPLPLHHEKPRSKYPPKHIYFCCVTPAQKGGGTIFANAEAIWLDIPKPIRDKMSEHGVMYKQFFHGKSIKHRLLKKVLRDQCPLSWPEYFGTNDKRQLEKKLTNAGVNWGWANKGNDLIIINKLPGALNHPITNQTSWFNSAHYLNYYSNSTYGELTALRSFQYVAGRYLMLTDSLKMVCHYGNGDAFSSADIANINRVIQQHVRVLNWQKGDCMIVDNFTFMHGKEAHEGSRLLYSCMTG